MDDMCRYTCEEYCDERAMTVDVLRATIAQLREDQARWLAYFDAAECPVHSDETNTRYLRARAVLSESGALDRALERSHE